MFRHHKYCVIEVSGRLQRLANGKLYLLDNCGSSVEDCVTTGNALEIADSGLLAFMDRQLPAGDGGMVISARISGSVGTGDGVVQLAGVIGALLEVDGRNLRYSTMAPGSTLVGADDTTD